MGGGGGGGVDVSGFETVVYIYMGCNMEVL